MYGYFTRNIINFFADEVEIKFSGDNARLENKEYGTQPLVAHGNGPSKVFDSNLSVFYLKKCTVGSQEAVCFLLA